jgi:hypothetical protein
MGSSLNTDDIYPSSGQTLEWRQADPRELAEVARYLGGTIHIGRFF